MSGAPHYNDDGMRLTNCCKAHSTYCDHVLCCKACWHQVDEGQGDGSEYRADLFNVINIHEGTDVAIVRATDIADGCAMNYKDAVECAQDSVRGRRSNWYDMSKMS
jgi:hypothetical protein